MSIHRHFAQQFPTIYALSAIKNGIIMWNYDIFLCKSLEMLIYTKVKYEMLYSWCDGH